MAEGTLGAITVSCRRLLGIPYTSQPSIRVAYGHTIPNAMTKRTQDPTQLCSQEHAGRDDRSLYATCLLSL